MARLAGMPHAGQAVGPLVSMGGQAMCTAWPASTAVPVTGSGYAQYEATLSSAADSRAARDTVDRLRNAVHPLGAKVGGTPRST